MENLNNIKTNEIITRFLNKPYRAFYSVNQQRKMNSIRLVNGRYIVSYQGKRLVFSDKSSKYEIFEQFKCNQYRNLNVKKKVVFDIGSGVGDTAIYFSINGAKKIYGFESEKERFETGIENIAINRIKNACLFNEFVKTLNIIERFTKENVVLKIDIEGNEHQLLKNTKKSVFAQIDEIIMEFHDGYIDIKRTLEKNGFKVKHHFSKYYTADFNGLIHAEHIRPWRS